VLHEQPLLIGAVGIALGALLGYALPTSDTEDRLFGEASDATARRVTEGAKAQLATASETLSKRASGNDTSAGGMSGADESTGPDHEAQGLSDRR
jgi:hypothetical protein